MARVTTRFPIGLCTLALLLQGVADLPAADKPTALVPLDKPFLFTYGTWEGQSKIEAAQIVLKGITNQGGGGCNLDGVDLSAAAGLTPAIEVTIGADNAAGAIRLMLRDSSEGTATWIFELVGEKGKPVVIVARDARTFSDPHEYGDSKSFNLANVTQWQLQGDWAGNKPVDLTVTAILKSAPTAEMQAAQTARRDELGRLLAVKNDRLAAAKTRLTHAADNPSVVLISPSAPDVLAIAIVEGEFVPSRIEPYVAQPGDVIERTGDPALVHKDGKLAMDPINRHLIRKVNGQPTKIGSMAGAEPNLFLVTSETRKGQSLVTEFLEDPQSYRISTSAGPYKGGLSPESVSQKVRPLNQLQPNGEQVVQFTVMLRLPQPLEEGTSYTIEFSGVNTREEKVAYAHDSRKNVSESVHVSHVGFRPNDPYKRAFVSLWLGTGGGYEFVELKNFELIDQATGKTAFEGPIKLAMAINGTEQLRVNKNYSQTAVYSLDFSQFSTPGLYRVHVPGVGCSEDFPIAQTAWEAALKANMRGYLCQRSGIALDREVAGYQRPRNLHPADGVKVYQSKYSVVECNQKNGDWFPLLVEGRTDETLSEGWGGYADAGDFDRAAQHLHASYLQLELMELFPDYFAKAKFALPAGEVDNKLPDLLDEALWNVEFFQRLQNRDGGVSGGIEQSAHPRPVEPSWLCSLVTLAYAPDPEASYLFAAVAAKAAKLLEPIDSRRSKSLAEASVRAWNWSEKNWDRFKDMKGNFGANYSETMNHVKNMAAAELLSLTKDKQYDTAFAKTTQLNDAYPTLIDQQGGAFKYARLPKGIGTDVLKAKARTVLLKQADTALAFAEGNVFGLTTEIAQLPEMGPVGYFTVPGMISQILPRAHALSGEEKYLTGIVRSTNFCLGANPQNMTFTTGLGHRAPINPLHIDSRASGQAAPAGLSLYGVSDPARNDGFNDWVHTYHLTKTMTPNSRAWPATEAYVDFFLWPMMCEFTIRQNLGPCGYTWGYLAARK